MSDLEILSAKKLHAVIERRSAHWKEVLDATIAAGLGQARFTDMVENSTPHPLEGKLEPECKDVQTPIECAMLSIAVSLKRIADQLDGDGRATRDTTSLADVLNAIPYLIDRIRN